MQDTLSAYPILRTIIANEIKKKNDRLEEFDKLVASELKQFKKDFEIEFSTKKLNLNFEPVLHNGSPSIRVQISNPQNSFVIHILLDSYTAPFLVGHRVTQLSGTQEGGEIAKNCAEIKVLLKKRVEAHTINW